MTIALEHSSYRIRDCNRVRFFGIRLKMTLARRLVSNIGLN